MKRDYAANSFNKGMIMDLNPLQMTDEAMTYCLNGTILTYNGNENALQCDMGNGRVETAVLPEGYIPMGTCSYGGIIYIVSYNPLKDLCQIGSFPSPERNIDSTELSPAVYDLKETDIVNKDVLIPSHKLELTTENLSPGDKFMVVAKDLDGRYLSDYYNTDNTIGGFPGLWKMRLASIEDSGKITYFDNVKWYDNKYYIKETNEDLENKSELNVDEYRSIVSSAYTIFKSKSSGKLAIIVEPEMIDDFSCSYSLYVTTNEKTNQVEYKVYLNVSWNTSDVNINPSCIHVESDKISGEFDLNNSYNLDLEHTEDSYKFFKQNNAKIKTATFNKEHSVGTTIVQLNCQEIDQKKKLYKIYNNGVPTKSYYRDSTYYYIDSDGSQVGAEKRGKFYFKSNKFENISDDIVNNEYDTDVSIHIGTLTDPKGILELKVTPWMLSGAMDHLSQTIKIDFDKVGTGEISLDTWRYYQYSDTLLLNWGIDANPKPGEDVSKVVMTFYDNQGPAACYIADDYTSYNGKFLNYINLDRTSEYYDISNILNDGSIIKHIGKQIEIQDFELSNYKDQFDNHTILITSNDDPLNPEFVEYSDSVKSSTHKFWENDSGILYKNILYLVKIDMYTSHRDTFTQTIGDPVTAWRWLWTNGIFNDQYDTELDFNELRPELNLRVSAQYSGTLIPESDESNKISYTFSENQIPIEKRIGDVVQKLKNAYIKVDTDLYFEDNYETFQIDAEQVSNITSKFAITKDIDNRGNIKSDPEEPTLIRGNSNDEVFTRPEGMKDHAEVYMKVFGIKPVPAEQEFVSAYTNDSVVQDVDWYNVKKPMSFEVNAEIHNPYFLSSDADKTTSTVTTIRPFIKYESDLHKYNLQLLKKYNPRYVTLMDQAIAKYWNDYFNHNGGLNTEQQSIKTYKAVVDPTIPPSPSKDIDDLVKPDENFSGSGGSGDSENTGVGGTDAQNRYGTITFRNALVLGFGDNDGNSCFRGAYIASLSKPYRAGGVKRILCESIGEDTKSMSLDMLTKDKDVIEQSKKISPLFYPTLFMAFCRDIDGLHTNQGGDKFEADLHIGTYSKLKDTKDDDTYKKLNINTSVHGRWLPNYNEDTDSYRKVYNGIEKRNGFSLYGGYIGCTTTNGVVVDFLNRPVSTQTELIESDMNSQFPWADRSVMNVASEFVLGLLGQLYYKDRSEVREGYHYKYLNYFEDRVVSYVKDILYKPVISNKVTNTNKLLLLRGLKYSDYLSSIATKAKLLADNVDYSNSKVKINQLVTNIPIILNFNVTTPDIEDGVINCQRWDIEQGKYIENRITLNFDSIGVYNEETHAMEDITGLTHPLYFMEYVPESIDREGGEENTFCLKKIRRPIRSNKWLIDTDKIGDDGVKVQVYDVEHYPDWKFSIQELIPYLEIKENTLNIKDSISDIGFIQNSVSTFVSSSNKKDDDSAEARQVDSLTLYEFFRDETKEIIRSIDKDNNVTYTEDEYTLQQRWDSKRYNTWNI